MTNPEFDPVVVEKAARALQPFIAEANWSRDAAAGVAARAVLTAVADDLRAEAWAEGARRGYALYDMRFDYVKRENPYRIEGGA